jgi:hypothetical protein
MHLPYESLKVNWQKEGKEFNLLLPWLTMTIDVEEKEKPWIQEATNSFNKNPSLPSVQKFFETLKDYPISYQAPRKIEEFKGQDLQPCPDTLNHLDFSTPEAFLKSLGVPLSNDLEETMLPQWTWDLNKILEKSRIPETTLYDPVSMVTYLIGYRLNWESTSWSGQDGLGQSLEALLKKDEEKFFRIMGWISRQSHYVTKQFHISVQPSLKHFPKAEKEIQHFIQDEVGHYKFMEQTLQDLGFRGSEEFSLGEGTRWMLDAFEEMGKVSPLAFSAMINIFEAAYYEGQDPLSRVLKKSSKPEAARGYDLHYKINQEHRHCDMPVILSKYLAPQTKEHVQLTVCLFECSLHFLDEMEKRILKKEKI